MTLARDDGLMGDGNRRVERDIKRPATTSNLAKVGVNVLSIGGAAAAGGVAGGVIGGGLGAAVGFAILGPAGAAVGFLIGLVGGTLSGAFAAGLAVKKTQEKLENK